MKVFKIFAIAFAITLFAGCGDPSRTVLLDDDQSKDDSDQTIVNCVEGKTRCSENSVFKCEDGFWVMWEDCTFFEKTCAVTGGEAQCLDSEEKPEADSETDIDTDDSESDEDEIPEVDSVVDIEPDDDVVDDEFDADETEEEPDDDGNTGNTGDDSDTGNTGNTGDTEPDEDIIDLCADVICTASDQCHSVGECDPTTGECSNPIRTGSCDDGNACTQTDTCQAGNCVGGNPVVCSALDQCHSVGTCNPETGICDNPVKTGSCNDGDACTQTDTCQAGNCVGGNPVVCSALGQCYEIGTCNSETGICSNPFKTGSCNDGDNYTINDSCENGVCSGEFVSCIHDSDCDNSDVCDGIETCDGNVCQSGTALDCDDEIRLTIDSCDPFIGCINDPVECIDDSDCTDDNICNGEETCDGNVCQPGTALDCDDEIRLTIDSCDPVSGCKNVWVECLDETDCIEGEFWQTPSCNYSNECLYDILCPAGKGKIIVPENWFKCEGYDKNWNLSFYTFYTDGIYSTGDKITNQENVCQLVCTDLNGNIPFTDCEWTDYPEENGRFKCKPPYRESAMQGGWSLWPGDHCEAE